MTILIIKVCWKRGGIWLWHYLRKSLHNRKVRFSIDHIDVSILEKKKCTLCFKHWVPNKPVQFSLTLHTLLNLFQVFFCAFLYIIYQFLKCSFSPTFSQIFIFVLLIKVEYDMLHFLSWNIFFLMMYSFFGQKYV